jgi:hypothetical protein
MNQIRVGYHDYILYPNSKQLEIDICGGKSGIHYISLNDDQIYAFGVLFDKFRQMEDNEIALKKILSSIM